MIVSSRTTSGQSNGSSSEEHSELFSGDMETRRHSSVSVIVIFIFGGASCGVPNEGGVNFHSVSFRRLLEVNKVLFARAMMAVALRILMVGFGFTTFWRTPPLVS
jgi:hypothetical protein